MEGWIIAGASLVPTALLLGWLAWASRRGDLERNGLVGIRIPSTMRSDAAWDAGHRAAAGPVEAAAWIGGAAGLCGVPLAVLGSWVGGAVVTAGYIGFTGLLLLGTMRAGRAARAAD